MPNRCHGGRAPHPILAGGTSAVLGRVRKRRITLLSALVFLLPYGVRAGQKTSPGRVSLTPRFVPGQTLLYEMEFQTTTATSRSGMATDPEGPSRTAITWDATVRLDILPAPGSPPGSVRVRTTYEKSVASVRSDSFAPAAQAIEDEYGRLQGKVVEFTLNADGKITSVSDLENVLGSEKSTREARTWMAKIAAGPGAPRGGVAIGQKWVSTQPATSLPVAGMAWRTTSEYLRNEPCRPSGLSGASAKQASPETCAVILTNLNLVRTKRLGDPTPPEFRKYGVRTAGAWNGSGQSLSYISLKSGFVVSVTQTASENMDMSYTTSHGDTLHDSGTMLSRSQVTLDPEVAVGK